MKKESDMWMKFYNSLKINIFIKFLKFIHREDFDKFFIKKACNSEVGFRHANQTVYIQLTKLAEI
jgi:hypothetical protein